MSRLETSDTSKMTKPTLKPKKLKSCPFNKCCFFQEAQFNVLCGFVYLNKYRNHVRLFTYSCSRDIKVTVFSKVNG